MDRGAWWAIVLGVAKLDMTERLTLSLLSCITASINEIEIKMTKQQKINNSKMMMAGILRNGYNAESSVSLARSFWKDIISDIKLNMLPALEILL